MSSGGNEKGTDDRSLRAQSASFPARFAPTEAQRRSYGDETLARLGAMLSQADPLADAVVAAFEDLPKGRGFALFERALTEGIAAVPEAPDAFKALFASVDVVPDWVDRARQTRGGGVILRAGFAGGIVLGMKSLMLGYASPGGNKPLVFSGRLQQQAPRRLAETSRFVQAVSQPGGLDRFAPGFAITLKVRLMHAQVRRLIQRSDRWREELWGAPINQHDMLATVLLFSVALVDGLRTIGYGVTESEAEDVIHLWRHVGLIMGVVPDVLPTSYAEAFRLAEVIQATQGPPDDDARALAAALFSARAAILAASGGPRTTARRIAGMYAVCRLLIGEPLASAMAIPRSPFDNLAKVVRPAAGLASRINRLPFWQNLAMRVGDRYWDAAVAEGLGRATARYAPPDRLAS
ncbi:MAG TPA: oxygenase MpaB family protein [Polyangia bacterium]